ncbi:MAG: hypothetical protein HYZ00_06435 [Candidatus Hydrogenedentes bacterium]|nr:hypothetical protein [Candidatus Hydrogenedentota bacterium]
MSISDFLHVPMAGVLGAAATVDELVANIKNDDENVRTEAWRGAGDVGAAALPALAGLAADAPQEVARAAKRGMWRIVRHSGRPGAEVEREAVSASLLPLLAEEKSVNQRREILWMISEASGDDAVAPVAALLEEPDLRDSARMVLERIPGDASLKALKAALDTAPEDFKPNIAHSLRVRGVEVSGYPSANMTPAKSTEVKPLETVPAAAK